MTRRTEKLLEGLLRESEDFWGHSRTEQLNPNLPELSRFLYRTLVESKDETEQKEESVSELSSDLSAKALKDLGKPNIKVKHPQKLELTNLSKTSASAVKRLEQKHVELSGLLIAAEASDKLKGKPEEVSTGLKILGDFLNTFKRMHVLLEINLTNMSEEDCRQEKDNVAQLNQNATEHLDAVNALLKKIRGWMA